MFAFEITPEDIEAVLHANLPQVVFDGRSVDEMAADLIDELDAERIEQAALRSGCDLNDQTQGAHDEIAALLREMGVIDRF